MGRRRLAVVLAVTAAIVAAAALSPASGLAPAFAADDARDTRKGGDPLVFALIGDTPYGDVQRMQLPALVDAINADPDVRMVLHAGDVKDGRSACSDQRYGDLAALFDTFEDPFVLTPGDNEWTDCHRPPDGSYLPTERLDAVRRYFFARPGRNRWRPADAGAHPGP
jgi:hypothetical protein